MDEKIAELIAGIKDKDGALTEDKVIELIAQKQHEVDQLYKESKKRGEKLKGKDEILAERETALLERESAIKTADEEKLRSNEEFKTLLAVKEAEVEKLKGLETQVKDLTDYKNSIREQQAARLESKVNALGEKQRELFESVASGMQEDAFEQKLDVVDKLTAQTEPPPGPAPSGGRANGTSDDYKDPAKMYALKDTNPDLYHSIISERLAPKAN